MRVIRARFAVLAVTAAAMLAGCGGPAVPPAQNYPSVHGRAYDSATNQPVAGVNVAIATILTATTASDGTYKIVNIPIGQYTLNVTPPSGYTAPLQPLYSGSLAAGENVTIDIPLTKQ